MKIQLAVPHTLLGRVITTLLVVLGVTVIAFFFAAILIVVAVAAVIWFIRSAITGRKAPTIIRPDEEDAEYEVLPEDVRPQNAGGNRLLPGNPASGEPSRENGSKSRPL